MNGWKDNSSRPNSEVWRIICIWWLLLQVAVCAERHLHDWSLARDTVITSRRCYTWTPLATHPTACQVQSGMSGSPVAVSLSAVLARVWLLLIDSTNSLPLDVFRHAVCQCIHTWDIANIRYLVGISENFYIHYFDTYRSPLLGLLKISMSIPRYRPICACTNERVRSQFTPVHCWRAVKYMFHHLPINKYRQFYAFLYNSVLCVFVNNLDAFP